MRERERLSRALNELCFTNKVPSVREMWWRTWATLACLPLWERQHRVWQISRVQLFIKTSSSHRQVKHCWQQAADIIPEHIMRGAVLQRFVNLPLMGDRLTPPLPHSTPDNLPVSCVVQPPPHSPLGKRCFGRGPSWTADEIDSTKLSYSNAFPWCSAFRKHTGPQSFF